MLLISDRVDGARVAPATPSSARAAISSPGLVAYAASTEAAANPAAPVSSRRRRPIRSPRVPIVISDPARTKQPEAKCTRCGCTEDLKYRRSDTHGLTQTRNAQGVEPDPSLNIGPHGISVDREESASLRKRAGSVQRSHKLIKRRSTVHAPHFVVARHPVSARKLRVSESLRPERLL